MLSYVSSWLSVLESYLAQDEEEGQGLVEYALIIVLVSIVSMVAASGASRAAMGSIPVSMVARLCCGFGSVMACRYHSESIGRTWSAPRTAVAYTCSRRTALVWKTK